MFLTVSNDVEGANDFWDLCKYGYVCQAKGGGGGRGGPWEALVPLYHPWNKQTNKIGIKQSQIFSHSYFEL